MCNSYGEQIEGEYLVSRFKTVMFSMAERKEMHYTECDDTLMTVYTIFKLNEAQIPSRQAMQSYYNIVLLDMILHSQDGRRKTNLVELIVIYKY